MFIRKNITPIGDGNVNAEFTEHLKENEIRKNITPIGDGNLYF